MSLRCLVLSLFLLPISATAQDITISCEGSSEKATLEVPEPADKFVHIVCTKFGHIINPVAGWFWTIPGTFNPQFYPSQMVRSAPEEVGNSVYFDDVTVNQLSGEQAADKWSILAGMFDESEGSPSKALEIIASSSMGDAHTIYIFPNKFGYSCSPTCRAENAFVMVSETDEDVSW